jgi:hypothetical protein
MGFLILQGLTRSLFRQLLTRWKDSPTIRSALALIPRLLLSYAWMLYNHSI